MKHQLTQWPCPNAPRFPAPDWRCGGRARAPYRGGWHGDRAEGTWSGGWRGDRSPGCPSAGGSCVRGGWTAWGWTTGSRTAGWRTRWGCQGNGRSGRTSRPCTLPTSWSWSRSSCSSSGCRPSSSSAACSPVKGIFEFSFTTVVSVSNVLSLSNGFWLPLKVL